MKRTELGVILEILKVTYPAHFTKIGNMELLFNLWMTMFKDEPAESVSNAVYEYIATDTSGYFPSIGALREIIAKRSMRDALTEDEAWAMVRTATSNGYYGAEEEFRKLPRTVQKIVGNPEQLRDWAVMDSESFNTVVASNFRRSYRTQTEKEQNDLMLPQSIKQNIALLTDGKV